MATKTISGHLHPRLQKRANSGIHEYINNVRMMNAGTAEAYQVRLRNFEKFVITRYKISTDELVTKLKKSGIYQNQDPYALLNNYIAYLQQNSNISTVTVKQRIVTAKNFLEYYDVDISPRKFKLKVKLPKIVRKNKEALTKSDVANILNSCSEIRLKTYVMLLAGTGTRASEALSIRLQDCNLETQPATVFIRGEYTKTRIDRVVFLTNEMVTQLKTWLEYKYRPRRICFYDKNEGKTVSEYRIPKKNNNDLLFSANRAYLRLEDNKVPLLRSVYHAMAYSFAKTLDRMGKGDREENKVGKRRKITLHSFRRWVKSTISDLGYGDYSEWFIGHTGSTYYRKTDHEKAEIFKKIESYLTFLDIDSLERKGSDVQSKLEQKDKQIETLMKKQEQFEQLIQSLVDSGQLKSVRDKEK